jgi:hypothetical protein
MMKQNLKEAAATGPARGGFDSDETCFALEPEWHEDQTCAYSHPACFQDLAQTAARSSERLPSRTLLHLAPLQLFAYPIYVQHNSRKKQQLILKIQSHAYIEAFCNHQI